MEKRWSGKEGDPASQVTPLVSSAVEWPLVALICPQLSLGILLKRGAIKGRRVRNGREGRGESLLPITPRALFGPASRGSTRVDCEQSLFFFRFSKAIFVSRAFPSRD